MASPQTEKAATATAAGAESHQLFLGTFIHSKSLKVLEYLHDTAICVDAAGKIVAIEPQCDLHMAEEVIFPRLGWSAGSVTVHTCKAGQFFFPGFIDTHIHASQYPNVGIFGNSTLLDWLHKYTFPLEASLARLPKARRVYGRCIRRTLAHGTTTAAYYATVDVAATNLLADLCLAAGQRALVGRVCMDRHSLSPDFYRDEGPAEAEQATRACIAHIQQVDPGYTTVKPIITPRFAPSCTGELLGRLGALQRETGLPVQTHISESRAEVKLVEQLFREDEVVLASRAAAAAAEVDAAAAAAASGGDGEAAAVAGENADADADAPASNDNSSSSSSGSGAVAAAASYAGVYDAFGLLTDRTILAHGVHFGEAEADLVARRGAKVAHCPCSNSAITSGAARVRWLLERGIDIGLGTDVSGGYSPSVLEAARQALLVSRHVAMGGDDAAKLSVEEVLFLATRGGAQVVGLAPDVGGFELGMRWDAQLVGLGRVAGKDDGDGDGDAANALALNGGQDDEGEGKDGGNVDVFGWETWDERVAKWLFSGDDRNTKKVWVNGRLVHERKDAV